VVLKIQDMQTIEKLVKMQTDKHRYLEAGTSLETEPHIMLTLILDFN
jgi:hypothetical protein